MSDLTWRARLLEHLSDCRRWQGSCGRCSGNVGVVRVEAACLPVDNGTTPVYGWQPKLGCSRHRSLLRRLPLYTYPSGGAVPVVSTKELLDRALADRYGVAAFNIVNDLSIEAVLAAATAEEAPVILQTSVKTVRMYGNRQLFDIFESLARDVRVPVALHLDHCPERSVITDCLAGGWSSVLFDAHELDIAENIRQTTQVVAEARRTGAHVEGEIEGIQGVEDGVGSDGAPLRQSLEVAVDFIHRTQVDCFAPAIGNAHGQYAAAPTLDFQRVSDLVDATGVPMALHGGTGLSTEQFQELISRGCAKVNISTALKETYMQSSLEFLRGAEEKSKWDPPSFFKHQRSAVMEMARRHMRLFGSSGRSW